MNELEFLNQANEKVRELVAELYGFEIRNVSTFGQIVDDNFVEVIVYHETEVVGTFSYQKSGKIERIG